MGVAPPTHRGDAQHVVVLATRYAGILALGMRSAIARIIERGHVEDVNMFFTADIRAGPCVSFNSRIDGERPTVRPSVSSGAALICMVVTVLSPHFD